MSRDWSEVEVDLIVSDYFSMLQDELLEKVIKKSEHKKSLQPLLNNRSVGSIEFKHRNISAVLESAGRPFIKGYKPLYNFQRILIDKVDSFISLHKEIEGLFEIFTNRIPVISNTVDFKTWVVSAPDITTISPKKNSAIRRAVKVNYLEKEQMNRDLGLKGEEMALEYERFNLILAGKPILAESVEWVSRDKGDGLGYDILSKNLDGTDKFIEVKTTKLSREAAFFFTSNELSFSIENSNNFHLYRVFEFGTNPKMFHLKGRYDNFCTMESILYKGKF